MTRNRNPPQVGQVLYSLNVRNAAWGREQVLTPMTVIKVGRKYFTTAIDRGLGKTQFHISDWSEKTEYTSNHRLYESEREWLDDKEADDAHKYIHDAFDCTSPRLPLEVLRRIRDMLTQYKEQQDETK